MLLLNAIFDSFFAWTTTTRALSYPESFTDSLWSIASYILLGLALYRMAKACGLNRAFLAWIPLANMFTLGSIAETGVSREGKKPMAYRIILPVLTGVVYLLTFVIVMMALISFGSMILSFVAGNMNLEVLIEELLHAGIPSLLLIALLSLALSVCAIVMTVYEYMALWHIFKLFDPKNATLFLVLSIVGNFFFPVIMPIFLLVASFKTPAPDPNTFADEFFTEQL